MKRISTTRLSALFGTLILIIASCSKDAPIVQAPSARLSPAPTIAVPTCDSPCFVVQIPATLDVTITVNGQQWEDRGAKRYAFPIRPFVAKVFPDVRYSDGYIVEFMFVNTSIGNTVIYPGAEIIYEDGLLYFDDNYVFFSPFEGQSLPSYLSAKLKLRF